MDAPASEALRAGEVTGLMASRKRMQDRLDGLVRARAAEVAAAAASDPEPPKRPPGRKDRRHWCRGKQGVPHQPVIMFCPPPAFRSGMTYECKWASFWYGEEVGWRCHHQEHCSACGRILQATITDGECPAYPGSQEQKAAAEAEAIAAAERVAAWRARRRPVINGPQGYRRKRENAS